MVKYLKYNGCFIKIINTCVGPPDMNVYLMSFHHQISKMGSVWVITQVILIGQNMLHFLLTKYNSLCSCFYIKHFLF